MATDKTKRLLVVSPVGGRRRRSVDQEASPAPFSYLDLDSENSGDDITIIDTGSDIDEDFNDIDDDTDDDIDDDIDDDTDEANDTSDSEGSGDDNNDDEDLVIFEFRGVRSDVVESRAA